MSDFELVHLKGFRCSGRAVRFVPLDPTELETVQLLATKEIDATSSVIDLKRHEWKLGVHQMIKQVSLTADPTMDPNGHDLKWKKVTPAVLDSEYKELFTAKDHQLLVALYRQYHDVTDEEIRAISGKVQTVSGD
jgi:hypothetical protein